MNQISDLHFLIFHESLPMPESMPSQMSVSIKFHYTLVAG